MPTCTSWWVTIRQIRQILPDCASVGQCHYENGCLGCLGLQILPTVPWYKERLLSRISLGSLMVIILIRTVRVQPLQAKGKPPLCAGTTCFVPSSTSSPGKGYAVSVR